MDGKRRVNKTAAAWLSAIAVLLNAGYDLLLDPVSVSAAEYVYDEEFEEYLDEQGFPESYKDGLRQLHADHPTWVFEAFVTGLDWEDVIDNEMTFKRNLVIDQTKYPSGYKDTTIAGSYDWENNQWYIISDPYWVQASREAVEYFMDPRNWFDEQYFFQFELETFNKEAQTLEGVEKILEGTFMSNTIVEGSGSDDFTSSNEYLSSSICTVSESYISGVSLGTSIREFSSSLTIQGITQSGQLSVVITDKNGNEKSYTDYIGTGDVVSLTQNGETLTSCQVVILGDIDGNGLIDSVDRAYVKAYVYGTLELDDIQQKAADANQDSTINSVDRAYMKASVYKTMTILQVIKNSAITYGELFMQVGEELNVSPYLLASRVRQEQGVYGTSDLISGTYSGYEGYYNYFNIKAYGTTREEIITNGLNEAKENGWDSRYKAIVGGATYLCEGHIWKGQDTLYLQKFDVESEYYGLYWHQYMQNLLVATNEGKNVYLAYKNLGALDETFVFKIPVYENMPDSCPEPTTDGNPNYKLKSLSVSGYTISFDIDTYDYYIDVKKSVTSLTVDASAIASTTTVTGTGKISIDKDTTSIQIKTKAENGSTSVYTIHLNRT